MNGTGQSGRRIDLNCDLGESAGRLADGTDAELLRWVTSANIACGGHAGDEATMRETVRAAVRFGVAVGAHPSYPDRANFGRAEMAMTAREVEASVAGQIAALDAVARSPGAGLSHVKPHGALYHAAMTRREVAGAVARASAGVNSGLILVGLAGAAGLDVWRGMGCRVAAEAFADRRYEPDGSLRSRSAPDALIHDGALAAAQAVSIARGEGVVVGDGGRLRIAADTICIHSDTPGAPGLARAVRQALEAAGIAVRPLT